MATTTTAMPPPVASALNEAQEFGMIGNVGAGGGGAAPGTGQGFGNGHGRLGGAHSASTPTLRQEAVTITGPLPTEVVQRVVRQNFGRFRLCYENGLRTNANLQGRVSTRFTIATDGSVKDVRDSGSDLPDQAVAACVRRGFENLSFPASASTVAVVFPIRFSPGDGAMPQNGPSAFEKPIAAEPYTGKFQNVMSELASGRADQALDDARAWNKEEPGDVLALVALGEAYEMEKDLGKAARAYGSLIDLFPARADMRRFAGVRLERISAEKGVENAALDLAIDTFEKAETQRPDHPESHRLVAFAHLKKGEHEKAFEAGVRGVKQTYPSGRFLGVDQILREDLGLIGAAWIHAEPKRKDEILQKVKDAGGTIEDAPSLRFVLDWETDANDVDFHIFDDQGGHAFYSAKHLSSGGDLYADVTTGYGPECFTIRAPKEKRARQYTLQANYYSRGPMGYGMGKLEILDHDGSGNITFQERPFVVMLDHAFVNLGTVTREK
jgi:tetratricopeptide (TPR) repeat protein